MLSAIISTTIVDRERVENILTQPDSTLVNTTYNFCSILLSLQKNTDLEKPTLSHSNITIKYQSLTPKNSLKSFISKNKGK